MQTTELTNESHGDEQITDITSDEFKQAKAEIIEKLMSGECVERDIAIDNLINNQFFWKAVFSLADQCGKETDYNKIMEASTAIAVTVDNEAMFQADKS